MSVPDSFRVLAIMPVYNEADILSWMLRHLIERGIGVHVLDNWSTDGSWELAAMHDPLVTVERWPAEGPQDKFNWEALCHYISHLAVGVLRADWFVLHGADQYVEAPSGGDLREAIWRVWLAGYNAINFTMHEYYPTDDGFKPGVDDPVTYFTSFEAYGRDVLPVTDSWKAVGPIDVSNQGAHDVAFEASGYTRSTLSSGIIAFAARRMASVRCSSSAGRAIGPKSKRWVGTCTITTSSPATSS